MTAEPVLFALLAAGFMLFRFADAWWAPLIDPDLFWQLWAGRQMLAGHFTTINGFSWTAPLTPWIHHEPLVALCYAAAGLSHAGQLRGLVVSATAVAIAALAWKKESAWATLLATLWAILLVYYGSTERALTWGNLLLALLALVLCRVDARHRWRMPLACVLVALWANIHGSFVIGVIMIGLARPFWGLAAMALSLCNPHGPGIYGLLLGYGIGSDAQSFIHATIPEWRPLDLATPLNWLRAFCVLASGYLLARDRRWRMVALWACCGLLALLHQRFFDVLGIALLPAVGDAAAARVPLRRTCNPAPLLAAALLAIALLAPPPSVDEGKFPTALILRIPANARLWNDFELGGWLGYYGRPCFWDSRNDCYPLCVLEDGLRIQRRREGWRETLFRWNADAIVTSDRLKTAQLRAGGWRQEAAQGEVALLVRPGGAAGHSIHSLCAVRKID